MRYAPKKARAGCREGRETQDIDFFSETAFPPLETSCKKELSVSPLRLTAGGRARERTIKTAIWGKSRCYCSTLIRGKEEGTEKGRRGIKELKESEKARRDKERYFNNVRDL